MTQSALEVLALRRLNFKIYSDMADVQIVVIFLLGGFHKSWGVLFYLFD